MHKQPRTREDGKILIFRRYITRNGKLIPPPKGKKAWPIWVYPDARNDDTNPSVTPPEQGKLDLD